MANTIRLNPTDQDIMRNIHFNQQELEIPEYLDKDEVNEVMEGATILWQEDNESNFTVLGVWINEESPFHSMVYFSRFFKIGENTHVSHDATGNNLIQTIMKLSEKLNHFLQR